MTALLQAVHLAPAVSEMLLKVGVPADQPDSYGRTPVWQAACVGNAGVVKLLLRRGADPTRHPAGSSAVECARESQPYERLYPQRLIDSEPPYIKDFDAVLDLLEQAVVKRQRK